MTGFKLTLIKNLFEIVVAVLFTPFYFLFKKRWFAAIGIFIIVMIFGIKGYFFVVGLTFLAMFLQLIVNYKHRDILTENMADDWLFKLLVKIGLAKAEDARIKPRPAK